LTYSTHRFVKYAAFITPEIDHKVQIYIFTPTKALITLNKTMCRSIKSVLCCSALSIEIEIQPVGFPHNILNFHLNSMLPLSQVALVATHSPTQMYGLKFIKQKHSAIGS